MKSRKSKFCICTEIENLRIYITLYGGFFYHENVYSPTHSHNSYEFHLMMDGESTLTSKSDCVVLNKAQACIVAPNAIHTCTSGNEKHVKITFCFSFEKINKKTKKDLYRKFSELFGEINEIKKIANAEQYVRDLNQILTTFYSRKEFASIRLKELFLLLIISLAEELTPDSLQTVDESGIYSSSENVEKNIRSLIIEDYINQNYKTNISLKDLAQILYLSEKQTERIVKKEIGMSFKEFVMKIRLEAALYYLLNTDLPIEEIAARVGYESYNGFYKLFSQQIGQSPREYRKNNTKI